MGKDVIIACDFSSKADTLKFLERFGEKRPFVKIGMELYYAEGPEIVKELKSRGHKVFVDLKIHDIPNTAAAAMRVLGHLGADIVNVHAAGTKKMMEAARKGLDEGYENFCKLSKTKGVKPLLIAVTQLTSTDQISMQEELLIGKPIEEVVEHYAETAMSAGLDGVVCSAQEAGRIHKRCGTDFITVTPGIRFADSQNGDQKRVMTPSSAKEIGADYIVVGRPITKADDAMSAYERCCNEFIG